MGSKFQQKLAFFLGACAALAGLFALLAWLSGRGLTFGPLSGRMRPELAVAFCFGGAGVLASLAGRIAVLRLCAALTAIASAMVLVDLRDSLQAPPGTLPLPLPSEETAGSTGFVAAALLAVGVGLGVLTRWPNASRMLGLLGAGIGFIFLLDRGLEATAPFSWPDAVATSARTGAALLMLGWGLFLEGSRRREDDQPGITPWMVAAVGVLASLSFWGILSAQERTGLARLVEATAAGLRAEVSVALAEVMGEMEILAERTGRSGPAGADPARWQSRTRRLMRLEPSIVAIDWIAPDGALLASARSETLAEPVRLTYPPLRDLERLRADSGEAPSALVKPYLDLPESLRVTALVDGTAPDSVIEAIVDMRQLVSGSVTATDLANAIRIAVGDDVVFDNPGTNLVAEKSIPPRVITWTPPGADDWSISVGPSQNLVVSALSPLPNVVLGAGILISLLLAAVLSGTEIQRRRAAELEKAVRVVEMQSAELRRAQRRLRELNEELENRVRSRTEELSRANAYLREENRLRTRAQQHLTRVNDNLRRFDAFISHELRQPLAAMRLWLDLLESTAGESLAEQQRGYLEKSSGEIRRMTRLIEDELRLSKASHGEPPTDPVDLDLVLAEVAEELGSRLSEIGARLEVGALPVVRASRMQMQQLFTNLVENAIKYHRPDVAPVIRVERVGAARCSTDAETEDACEIVVADNGQGFSVEPGTDVFDMFSRRASNDATPGWGIGLAICKRIAERHDGSIWAESNPGAGTRVHVVLPLAQGDPEAGRLERPGAQP